MATDLARAVGDRIRRFREARGWTQDQLGERTAVSRSQICRYENGAYVPNGPSLVRLAEELGVTTDELLGVTPGVVAEQFEDWLLRFPAVHHAPLRNLVQSYLKTHRLDDLMARPTLPRPQPI
jgi:transcriptional regulator with XRE-family HTH domain